jgi:hypothetical protein
MWGVNGAFSVLGSIVAVAISIFVGIHANLLGAAALYGVLVFPLAGLQKASATWPERGEDVDLIAGEAANVG